MNGTLQQRGVPGDGAQAGGNETLNVLPTPSGVLAQRDFARRAGAAISWAMASPSPLPSRRAAEQPVEALEHALALRPAGCRPVVVDLDASGRRRGCTRTVTRPPSRL